jgi:hypothetical protein
MARPWPFEYTLNVTQNFDLYVILESIVEPVERINNAYSAGTHPMLLAMVMPDDSMHMAKCQALRECISTDIKVNTLS